jgi:hypothetical protein
MSTLTEIFLILAGGVSVYALVTALFTFRAIKLKRYESYKQRQDDFDRLDAEVKKAFERDNYE